MQEQDIVLSYPKSFEEEMAEVENYISGEEPPHTFGYYCGLGVKDFPPARQLSKSDMRVVSAAFNEMMHTWSLAIELPSDLPVPFAYKLTVDTLNMNVDIPTTGFVHFDFCTGHAPTCIFKEYCGCLEYWNTEEN